MPRKAYVGVLSISKFSSAPDPAAYSLEAIANDRDDYYLASGEAPGRWIGAGAERLGLTGDVEPGALRAVLEGRDPSSGEPLVAFSRRRVAIEASVIEHGARSARGAQVATLDSRPAKPVPVNEATLRREWTDRAAELGFSGSVPTGTNAPVVTTDDVLGGVMTEQNASFDRPQAFRAVAETPHRASTTKLSGPGSRSSWPARPRSRQAAQAPAAIRERWGRTGCSPAAMSVWQSACRTSARTG